jgi:magnesium-transporting ATPase (P-type)
MLWYPVCCTGDHALTGLAIGKMLGIAGNGSVVTGPELDSMSDDQLKLVSLDWATAAAS